LAEIRDAAWLRRRGRLSRHLPLFEHDIAQRGRGSRLHPFARARQDILRRRHRGHFIALRLGHGSQ
jgi:hypothetical protein